MNTPGIVRELAQLPERIIRESDPNHRSGLHEPDRLELDSEPLRLLDAALWRFESALRRM